MERNPKSSTDEKTVRCKVNAYNLFIFVQKGIYIHT